MGWNFFERIKKSEAIYTLTVVKGQFFLDYIPLRGQIDKNLENAPLQGLFFWDFEKDTLKRRTYRIPDILSAPPGVHLWTW